MSIAISALLLLGAGLFCLTAVGILRLPDALSRMHAASKGCSLGLCCILTACTLSFGSLVVAVKSVIVVLAVFITVPVATHLLARASMGRNTLGPHEDNNLIAK